MSKPTKPPTPTKDLTPCERTGHSYSLQATKLRWVRNPAVILICRKCGEKKQVDL